MAVLHRPALPAVRLLPWRLRPGKLLLLAAIALIVLMALVQVNQFSKVTSTSYEINDLNRLRAAREAQNHQLEAEIAQQSSLARVDLDARLKLGMAPAARTVWIRVNQPAPAQLTLRDRLRMPARELELPADEAWWVSVLKLATPF